MFTSRVTWVAIAGLVAAATSGCNSRHTVIDMTAPTLPSSVVGAPQVPASVLVSVLVEPSAVFSGGAASGRVLLSFPAPPEGMTVALSTSDAAATVPAVIAVPAGADAAHFAIATHPASSEIDVSIIASAGARVVQRTLALWTKTPPFAVTWTDPGNQQGTLVNRVTGAGHWRANCSGSNVFVSASESPVLYLLLFGAPEGTPLAPGTYEDAQTTWGARSPNRPMLDVSASAFRSCAAPMTSRFVVSEADLVADHLGTVRRFSVTFEQQCGAASIRGEMTAVDPLPTHTAGSRCILPQ